MMRAVRYSGPRDFAVTEVERPEPRENEVLLRVLLAGVCGTDVHLHDGEFGGVFPLTPGHEIVGEVVGRGSGVTSVELGTRVVVDNMTACGLCVQCRRARPAHCLRLRSQGVFESGGAAEYLCVDAEKCFDVGDLALDDAILAEPTACAIHGLDILDLRPGSSVLVLGAGPTALILTQLLRAAGAAAITVAGSTGFKLDVAVHLGADASVLLERGSRDGNAAAVRRGHPEGFDVVIDATGSTEMLELALSSLAIRGTLLVYGVTGETDTLTISPYDVFRRELTIKGSFAQAYSFDRAVAALRGGRVRSDGIITHRFALGEYGTAIETVRSDRGCLKAVLEPGR